MLQKMAALLLILALLAGCLTGFAEINAAQEAELTVMLYLCGNDLESEGGFGTEDMIEIAEAGFDPARVNVVVATGGAAKWKYPYFPTDSVAIWNIGADNEMSCDGKLPDASMGDPFTLTTFINHSVSNYPARRYALMLWNHGGGPVDGLCVDETRDDDCLTLPELRQALQATPFSEGKKLSSITMIACLMGSAEVADACAPFADYLVYSEASLYYPDVDFSFLKQAPDQDDRALNISIAESYIESLKNVNPLTMMLCEVSFSVVDLSKIKELEGALNSFARTLPAAGPGIESFTEDVYNVVLKRDSTPGIGQENAPYLDIVDIAALADSFSDAFPAAEQMKLAVEDAVVWNWSNFGSRGVSVYFPHSNVTGYQTMKSSQPFGGFAADYYGYTSGLMDFLISIMPILEAAQQSEASQSDGGYGRSGSAAFISNYPSEILEILEGFTVEEADGGAVRVSMPIPEDARPFIASMQLEVAEQNGIYGNFHGYFPVDYVPVPMGEQGVSLLYEPRELSLADADGTVLGTVHYSSRNGFSFIPVTELDVSIRDSLDQSLLRFDSETAEEEPIREEPQMMWGWLMAQQSEDGQSMEIRNVLHRDSDEFFPDDRKLHSSNSGLSLDSERFPIISFVSNGLQPVFTADGRIRPMDTWNEAQNPQDVAVGLIEADNTRPWSLRFSPVQRDASDLFAQLVVTDIFGQRHASQLVRLPNPCRPVREEPNLTLYEDEDGNRIVLKEISLVRDADTAGLALITAVTGASADESISLNYEMLDVRIDSASIPWEDSWTDKDGHETVYTAETTNYSGGTLPGITRETDIAVLISQEDIPAAESGHIESVSFDLAVYLRDDSENSECVWLVGEQDESFNLINTRSFTVPVDLDLSLLG